MAERLTAAYGGCVGRDLCGRQATPFSRAMVWVAKPQRMGSVGSSKWIQNAPSHTSSPQMKPLLTVERCTLVEFFAQKKNGECMPILNLKPLFN